jgi:hypothetical protein
MKVQFNTSVGQNPKVQFKGEKKVPGRTNELAQLIRGVNGDIQCLDTATLNEICNSVRAGDLLALAERLSQKNNGRKLDLIA